MKMQKKEKFCYRIKKMVDKKSDRTESPKQ